MVASGHSASRPCGSYAAEPEVVWELADPRSVNIVQRPERPVGPRAPTAFARSRSGMPRAMNLASAVPAARATMPPASGDRKTGTPQPWLSYGRGQRMTATRTVYVDASNVAYSRDQASQAQGGRPRLANILAVRDVVREWGAAPIILADSNLSSLIDDPAPFDELTRAGELHLVTDRRVADLALLERAGRDRAPILSHDGFDDHKVQFPWAYACVVDCVVENGIVYLDANKLALILGITVPARTDLVRPSWTRVNLTYRHANGVALAREWLRSTPSTLEPEPGGPLALPFPTEPPLGALYYTAGYGRHFWRLARGNVHVARGMWLGLEIRGSGFCDLSPLRSIPAEALAALWWDGPALTDDDQLEHLRHLTGLRELTLQAQAVTDSGLESLAQLSNLESLTLDRALAGPDGNLIRRCRIPLSARGISWLASLRKLNSLCLRGADINRAAGCLIGTLQHLVSLDLSDSNLDDSAAEGLSILRNVKYLILRNVHLTDVAIETLAQLRGLVYLDVRGTQMTEAWRKRLAHVRSPDDPPTSRTEMLIRAANGGTPRQPGDRTA